MKAILMSFKSKQIAKIFNHEKMVEIRKRFPLDYVGWVYIYCTENSKLLHKNIADIWWVEDKDFQNENKRLGIEQQLAYNGKVIGRFWCDNVGVIKFYFCFTVPTIAYTTFADKYYSDSDLQVASCLNGNELMTYLGTGKEEVGCAIPISKLEIFDEPKELNEFENYNMVREVELNAEYYKSVDTSKITVVKKAPQSWFYVEVRE